MLSNKKNLKRILCLNIINGSQCTYGTICDYAHSLSEQQVDKIRHRIYTMIKSTNSLENINLVTDNELLRGLVEMTHLCSACIRKECLGGYNCRNGAMNIDSRICYDDLMSGYCKRSNCVSVHLTKRGLIPYYQQTNHCFTTYNYNNNYNNLNLSNSYLYPSIIPEISQYVSTIPPIINLEPTNISNQEQQNFINIPPKIEVKEIPIIKPSTTPVHPKYILSNAPIVNTTSPALPPGLSIEEPTPVLPSSLPSLFPPGLNVKKSKSKELKNIKGVLLTENYLDTHFNNKIYNSSESDSEISQDNIDKIMKCLNSDSESDVDMTILISSSSQLESQQTESFDSIFEV